MKLDKILLFPYWAVLKLRDRRYKGGKRSKGAEVPTICVGNITAGGTGKTPHTEMILRMLLQSDMWGMSNIAVLSRGYKRESSGFQQVTREGSSVMFGDEPLQIKKKFPGVTVAVDKNRIEGCDLLCHPEKMTGKRGRKCWNPHFPAADIIVLDDAFQYRKLQADLNIVLVDYNRPLCKDHLIPIGRLRDLPERIEEADIVIATKCPAEMDNWSRTSFAYTLGMKDYSTSTCEGVYPDGKKQILLFTTIQYEQSQPVYENSDPRYIYSKKLILFTGIAKDTPLKNYLSDFYKIVKSFRFPDHHKYSWADFQKIRSAMNSNPTAAIATTEKDAQRVLDFNGMPEEIRRRMFMIPIKVDFLTDFERDLFRDAIVNIHK